MPTTDVDILADFGACLDEFQFAQCEVTWGGITATEHRSSVIRDANLLPEGKQDADAYILRIRTADFVTPYPETGDKVTVNGDVQRVLKKLDQGDDPVVIRLIMTAEYGR